MKNTQIRYDFMSKRLLAATISATLLIASIVSLATQLLNFGQDFTGGTLVEVGYPQTADTKKIRTSLIEAGFSDAIVQHFGSDKEILIRIAPQKNKSQAKTGDTIIAQLKKDNPDTQVRRVEFVGPQVGEKLTEDGILALLVALLGILVYVGFRFEYRFALGSVAALLHDVIITIGLFSIFRWEFDLNVLAAILAVIGYSLNDTIVVFDRIRENFHEIQNKDTPEIVNISLNQTLSRTLVTSLTTILVLIALLIFGGELIRGFAIALLIGVGVGTYSSIYVASNILLAMGIKREDILPPAKEGIEEE